MTKAKDHIEEAIIKELETADELNGFMGWEITNKTDWTEIDGVEGTVWINDIITKEEAERDYYCGEIYEIRTVNGFGARLSAPGYMDCTDWCVFDTAQEAADYLLETYAD